MERINYEFLRDCKGWFQKNACESGSTKIALHPSLPISKFQLVHFHWRTGEIVTLTHVHFTVRYASHSAASNWLASIINTPTQSERIVALHSRPLSFQCASKTRIKFNTCFSLIIVRNWKISGVWEDILQQEYLFHTWGRNEIGKKYEHERFTLTLE